MIFAGFPMVGELEALGEHGLEHLWDLVCRRSHWECGLDFEILAASKIRCIDLRLLDSKRSRQECERRVTGDSHMSRVNVEDNSRAGSDELRRRPGGFFDRDNLESQS